MSPPIASGDVIADRYVLGRIIGSGGAGIVFAAEHRALKKRVVLKFLRHESAPDSELVKRFVREARAAALLRSEHVVHILDAEILEPSLAFIAMEFLDGRDLAQVLEQDGPQPIPDAVDFVLQASEAIAEAHARGIIHRDIKPSNLFLTRAADGRPWIKVLDFGLSKMMRSNMSLTSENCVIGSPHFMSPEQMRSSRDTDVRTDIWALGAVLFTLLAGACPFPGRFLTEVCAAVLSGASVSLRDVRPEVPEGLEAVVTQCLALDPEARFQSVSEFAAALEPYAPADGAERVSRIKRIAEAADNTPASEAPLTLHQHLAPSSSSTKPKSPASVSAAVIVGTAALPQRQVLARSAVIGAAGLALVAAVALTVRTVLLQSGPRSYPMLANGPFREVSHAPTQAEPRTRAGGNPTLDPATSPAAPLEPRAAALAPANPAAQQATSAAVEPRMAACPTSSSEQRSTATRSKPSPANSSLVRRVAAPTPHAAEAISDEDLILSLPH